MTNQFDKKTKYGVHSWKWMTYKGEKIRIDRAIAPLISKLWELGIGTTNSCQACCSYAKPCQHIIKDNEIVRNKDCYQHIWICFDGARSYEKFLNIVAVYEKWENGKPEGMYEHILGYTKISHPHEAWYMKAYIENLGVLSHEERIPIPKDWKFPAGRKTIGVFEEDGCKKNNFKFMPQLHFPRKHLPYVEERLQLALYKKRK